MRIIGKSILWYQYHYIHSNVYVYRIIMNLCIFKHIYDAAEDDHILLTVNISMYSFYKLSYLNVKSISISYTFLCSVFYGFVCYALFIFIFWMIRLWYLCWCFYVLSYFYQSILIEYFREILGTYFRWLIMW